MKNTTWRKKERVAVYVDGFNLYFGMQEANLDKYKWLDLKQLAGKILKPNQQLVEINYFISRVTNDKTFRKDQKAYFQALKKVGVKLIYGNHLDGSEKCRDCGHKWHTTKEKMTDVNIATSMLIDAFYNTYDTAILISGDSDLAPPIGEIHKIFKDKKVLMAFPPKRYNTTLAKIAKGAFNINYNFISGSVFEEARKLICLEKLNQTKIESQASINSALSLLDLEKLYTHFSGKLLKH